MRSSCAQRGQGPCPGRAAVPRRAKLDPGEGRGLPSRPDPHSGGCRGSRRMQQAPQGGQHRGPGSAGPCSPGMSALCRRRWRWASQGEPDLLTEEEPSWGSEQRPGPRDSERRPLAGRLSGPEREEAGRPGEAAAMRGLGPGLSLRQGEQLGCLEPQAPRGSWSVCLIP